MLYIICKCFPLKVSKKKAYLMILLYALYEPVTDILGIILVGGGSIVYTGITYVILKINIFVEMFVYFLFMIKYLDEVWYRTYWITLFLLQVQFIPTSLYIMKFSYYDSRGYIKIITVTGDNILTYLFFIILTIAITVILTPLWRKMSNNRFIKGLSKWTWYVFYAFYFLLIAFGEKDYTKEGNHNVPGVANYKAIILFNFAIILAAIFLMRWMEKKRLRTENLLLARHKKLQYSGYLTFSDQEQEIIRLYHEIGDHIRAIQELLHKGEREKAESYTKELAYRYKNTLRSYYCNNKIINAVLSDKAKICEQNRISFSCELKLPDKLGIRDIDLMCAFSNLLDNAIEACLRYPQATRCEFH